MFVQVIKGRTNDAEGLHRQAERWDAEVRPGAIGHLGGTFGIADDGVFIVLARFEDEASARANSDRPEQQAWWEDTAHFIEGTPSFRESTDVTTLFEGGSDEAGFVQVMEGTVSDRAKAEAWETPEMLAALQVRKARPAGRSPGLVLRRIIRRGGVLHERGGRSQGRGLERLHRSAAGVHRAVRRAHVRRPPQSASDLTASFVTPAWTSGGRGVGNRNAERLAPDEDGPRSGSRGRRRPAPRRTGCPCSRGGRRVGRRPRDRSGRPPARRTGRSPGRAGCRTPLVRRHGGRQEPR